MVTVVSAVALLLQLAGLVALGAAGWLVHPALGCVTTGLALLALGWLVDAQVQEVE